MYLKREAEKFLQEITADGKVGIILGARQVGKTTLVEHVFGARKVCFLNFDIESDKARFMSAAALPPLEGLKALGMPEMLVIDEAQRMPEVSRIIKGWFDSRLPVEILLLGSSSLDLLSQSAESLTGRNRKLTLPPLLFNEAIQSTGWFNPDLPKDNVQLHFAPQLKSFLMQRLCYGSYPEVVTSSKPESLLRELSSDYLWKDVMQTGLVKHPDMIRRLLLLLAHQAGSEVSVSELATQLSITRATVERYLDLLVQTFVIFRLPSYSTNPRKEISKSQKIFFWDTGIRNALLNQFSMDELRPDIGKLWENWVIAEVAKNNMLRGFPAELYFWRTRSQSEVDLVIRSNGVIRAFEIKWSARHGSSRAFSHAYQVNVELITPNQSLTLGDI